MDCTKMIANYHTHTWRCNHAYGIEKQYIENAVRAGMRILGFSDHTPYPFPQGYVGPDKMLPSQLEDYVDTVLRLRDEYRDDIEIHLGLEAEYYPDLFEAMLELLRPYPVDYMILAQHFNDSRETIYNPHLQLSREALHQYVDMVVAGMETGKYSCVAHPDLFYFAGPDRVYQREMARICRRAKELDVPLEINILGLREGRCYPNDRFWPLVKAERRRAAGRSWAATPTGPRTWPTPAS